MKRRHFAYSLKCTETTEAKINSTHVNFLAKGNQYAEAAAVEVFFPHSSFFPRVIFGMVYLLSFLSLLQMIQFCLDASLF